MPEVPQLAEELFDVYRQILDASGQAKRDLKDRARQLDHDLAEAMEHSGVTEFTTTSGIRVTLLEDVLPGRPRVRTTRPRQ